MFWSYRNSSTVQGFCTNSSGNGTTKTCNFSIAEGRKITWCLERYDFSKGIEYTFKCKDDTRLIGHQPSLEPNEGRP